MTGIESYVHALYEIQDQSWMPRQEALCLTAKADDEDEEDGREQLLKAELSSLDCKLDDINERVSAMTAMAQKKSSN
jgi:hypothetical protein